MRVRLKIKNKTHLSSEQNNIKLLTELLNMHRQQNYFSESMWMIRSNDLVVNTNFI